MTLDDAAIVEAYERAKRAWADFRPDHDGVCVPEETAKWVWKRHLLRLELIDAWEELYLRVLDSGPIKTENGMWTLNAGKFLVFRRFIDVAYMGKFSCN